MKHYLADTNVVIVRKFLSHEQRIDSLLQLGEVIHTLPVDERVIKSALQSGWNDFEDAVQYYCA